MGLFNFFEEKNVRIDYDKIGNIIDGVVIKLNEYMVDVPDIILDQNKEKDLLRQDGTIDNKHRIDLASYYCAVLSWYYSNNKVSDGLVKYVDGRFPLLDKKTADHIWENSKDKSKSAEHACFHVTETILNLQIATHIKRMNGSSKDISANKMPEALGDNVLNEYFNQKCSEYNRTLLRESLKQVIQISKGENV